MKADAALINNPISSYSISHRPIPSERVIYVDGMPGGNNNPFKYSQTGTFGNFDARSKFNVNLGNVFISGTLNERLTIAARNDIYITRYNPTDWRNRWTETFTANTNNAGLVYGDGGFNYTANGITLTNESMDDMLGMVAQRYILILHYNWPRQGTDTQAYWLNSSGQDFDACPAGGIKIYSALFCGTNATGNYGAFGFRRPAQRT